ncbi:MULTISPECIES: hypothetical protein [Bacillus subtilis group]|uniref:hypothetical protein n=1 Tax=Bacillus subtilis group TaxID=653685 RepID=UPI00119E2F4F|nr:MULTISPECIES: hypothetical protein [Bacillus subtilis group]MEC2191688.1 hypothetical protein [Bacillus spizizenii]MEC2297468.1 hypothetical protein [Bacillus subtilis]MEC2400515.1 hypothetical protein [Bacillus subtilis]MED4660875.1 hypothetical protein [Bacillus subtilis]MED4667701.1 hypothetical protein [Bacillus subtilis]
MKLDKQSEKKKLLKKVTKILFISAFLIALILIVSHVMEWNLIPKLEPSPDDNIMMKLLKSVSQTGPLSAGVMILLVLGFIIGNLEEAEKKKEKAASEKKARNSFFE